MVKSPQELAGWLRLELTPGVGPETARRLLAAWGEPKAIFEQSESVLCQMVTAQQATALRQAPQGWASLSADTWQWLQATPQTGMARAVITLGDANYPASLLNIPIPR